MTNRKNELRNKQIVPHIKIQKWNLSQETKLFFKFLNHPEFPLNRRKIFSAFPELRETLLVARKKDERRVIRTFLRCFYKTHYAVIAVILHRDQLLLTKKVLHGFHALGKAMEYSWHKKVTYIATPTLLPFSPFGTNRFYFSIFGAITNRKGGLNAAQIAIHEVSHFIFFDILRRVECGKRIKLPRDASHFLKESLTAALLNEVPLQRVLGIKDYQGNPEIQALYIKTKNQKTPILLTDHIRELYRISKRGRKPLYETLSSLISSAYRARTAFSKKRAFWNRYGRKILSEPYLKARYEVPVLFEK